jgi:hypothetical protein
MGWKYWVPVAGWAVGMVFAHGGCECGAEAVTPPAVVTGGAGGQGGDLGGQGGIFNPGNGGGGGEEPPCENLECQQVDCGSDPPTTVSGTIYDPSGTLPLYNVGVYVPNKPLDPIPDGLNCEQCDAIYSGEPLVSALTDTEGKFVLENVPVGDDIPIVIQVGKWRRQITVDTVAQCTDTPLTDPQVTRLPRSTTDGEAANLPKIALTTGNSDALFCLLRRLGIDDSEYGIAGSAARIHLFHGQNGSAAFDGGFGASPGATFPEATTTLWTDGWENYDIVMMSCEGAEMPAGKDGHRPALRDYLDNGGRAFGTHYHYDWFRGPGGFVNSGAAGDAPADLDSIADFTGIQTDFSGLVDIDQTFPKGAALAEWMDFVDGSSPLGQFNVNNGRLHTIATDPTNTRVWARYSGTSVYFSFNSPIGAPEDEQCGRMVDTDIHVSAGDPNGTFPSACNGLPATLSEQEKALLFIFFDLSACFTPDDEDPCPPGQANCGGVGDPVCNGQCVDGCCQQIPD